MDVFDGRMGKRGGMSDFQLRVEKEKIVMQHQGLILRGKLKEDKDTFNLLHEGILKDPTGRVLPRTQRQLEHVWLAKGYRIDKVQGDNVDPDAVEIETLIGEYGILERCHMEFLGRHNGQEWIDDPNYRPPFSEPR